MERLFRLLMDHPRDLAVFNPWWDFDESLDATPKAPQIRRAQLRQYLTERLEFARVILVAEALGYQGGHFSGIPMTSERILLGAMGHRGIQPHHVMTGLQPQRTSQENFRPKGFTEPTATIVWSHLLSTGLDPYHFILWNAFPWHPYDPVRGFLSNRTPTPRELEAGHEPLHFLLKMANFQRILAVGKRAQSQLDLLDIPAIPLRHPANGGAPEFQAQFDGAMG